MTCDNLFSDHTLLNMMTPKSRHFLAFLISLISAPSFAHDAQPSATYLGNEGLLILGETSKVLFDPFFHNDYGAYQLVPEATRTAMFEGTAPYDGVNAIFISHAHEDHFSAPDLQRYMKAHPDVHLYAPKQAVDALMALKGYQPETDRITAVDLAYQDPPQAFHSDSLQVDVVRIPPCGVARPSGCVKSGVSGHTGSTCYGDAYGRCRSQ